MSKGYVSNLLGYFLDKNNTILKIGDYVRDDEGFVWQVKFKNKMYLECDDLNAREDMYPRILSCYHVGNVKTHILDSGKVIKV